jgi:hypothetical protein
LSFLCLCAAAAWSTYRTANNYTQNSHFLLFLWFWLAGLLSVAPACRPAPGTSSTHISQKNRLIAPVFCTGSLIFPFAKTEKVSIKFYPQAGSSPS